MILNIPLEHLQELKRVLAFGQFGQMVECSFKNYVVLGSSPVAVVALLTFEHLKTH